MPDARKLESTKTGAAGPPPLVLLCHDLESAAPGLALASLAQELASRLQGVQVRVEEGLCHRPAALKDALRQARAQRLVLGLCSDDYPAWEVQAHARKAGLDAFGVQVVDLGSAVAGASAPSRRQVGTLLAAAVARARAFPGSRPENEKSDHENQDDFRKSKVHGSTLLRDYTT